MALLKKAAAVLLSFVMTLFCISCGTASDSVEYRSPYENDFGRVIEAEITVRELGVIRLALYPDEAPETVANFTELASSGFYDGLIFHRVISGFVIQGGDPTGTGYGAEGQKTIKGEFASNGFANRISHVRGVISMARKSADNNSATSQFFIMLADKTQKGYLNGNYAAFGCVTEGMDVVDAIAAAEVDETSARPLADIVIESVRISGQ